MNACLYRPLLIGALSLALIGCMGPAPTVAEGSAVLLGVDLGSSGPVRATAQLQPASRATPHAGERHASHPQPSEGMQMVHVGHEDAHGTGTINSVDPAQHKVNLSHQPIPDIGWPAMTMDFPVAASVDLKAIKPGTRVNFKIEQRQAACTRSRRTPAAGSR
jgi:Cu/Ag efflux protein CusF